MASRLPSSPAFYSPLTPARSSPLSRPFSIPARAPFNLASQVTATKPDGFTPTIITRRPDYLYVEYESPLMGVSE
ncbi:unnamed protein product [Closterium sp. Naga37s-1]|nr:unnamed protein product [Closterium sp. Naga37s-1]